MERFSIDESGYTGFNLLNPEQPMQGAAAVSIEDELADRLVREHFPSLKATELKYRAVARRPRNHERIVKLLGDVLTECKCVTYVCDKRFLLVLHFLNYAAEPFYLKRGIDFYEDGQHFSLASLLYRAGPTLLGEERFSTILAAFQNAVRKKTPESLGSLVESVRSAGWQKLPEALGPIAQAAPECLGEIAQEGVSTDAALVVLQSLISRMEVMAEDAYRVEHDQSKNLTQYGKLLSEYASHDEAVTFRQSDIASVSFPLKLAEVVQVDSKGNTAVQIADVLVGATIDAVSSLCGLRQPTIDPESVMALFGENQLIHLLPNLDFEANKRFRSGSESAMLINYFSKNFGRGEA